MARRDVLGIIVLSLLITIGIWIQSKPGSEDITQTLILKLLKATEPLVILATLSVMIAFYLLPKDPKEIMKMPDCELLAAILFLISTLAFSASIVTVFLYHKESLYFTAIFGLSNFGMGIFLMWYETFYRAWKRMKSTQND